MNLPDSARAVVIGGGVAGCSVAYHLARLGWTEVILVERHALTEGTTWHSAGFVGRLRSTAPQSKMIMYSAGLYPELAELTGMDPGWRGVGGLRLATTPERVEESLRLAGAGETYGLDLSVLSGAETGEMLPLLDVSDVRAALWLPGDGWLDPVLLARALAAGAEKLGVRILTGTRVTGIDVVGGEVRGVRLASGPTSDATSDTAWGAGADIASMSERDRYPASGATSGPASGTVPGAEEWSVRADVVIIAAGAASGRVGRLAGVDIPVVPIRHQYVVTEPFGVSSATPTVQDPDNLVYFREEDGGILVGGYIRATGVWETERPLAEPRTLFAPDTPKFQELWESAGRRLPALSRTSIAKTVHGPEAFTPDGEFLLGETAVRGLWAATGLCVHGAASAGGVGKVMAEWIVGGTPEYDVFGMDLRRFGAHARSTRWARARALDSYSTYCDIVHPGEERTAARPLRRSPAWVRHAEMGAVFGEKSGWERVNWFEANTDPSLLNPFVDLSITGPFTVAPRGGSLPDPELSGTSDPLATGLPDLGPLDADLSGADPTATGLPDLGASGTGLFPLDPVGTGLPDPGSPGTGAFAPDLFGVGLVDTDSTGTGLSFPDPSISIWSKAGLFGGGPSVIGRLDTRPADEGSSRRGRPAGWAGRVWSPAIRQECLATRDAAGLFDRTSFSKLEVSGHRALEELQRVCAGQLDRPTGSVVYTQLLNERGGIEAGLTVTRLAEDRFRLVTGTASGVHDAAWLRGHGLDVQDVTSAHACYCLWGPQALAILGSLSDDDLTFGYMKAREIAVGGVPVLAQRVTFVGEFGWELYCPSEYALTLWDTLMEAGRPYGMRPGGYRAIDSMRLEKGYRVWGLDITPETTPAEAGLGFAVAQDKDFLGRSGSNGGAGDRSASNGSSGDRGASNGSTGERGDKAPARRLRCLVLDDPEQICLGGEPVRFGGEPASRVTSGGYGHRVDHSIAYAYLPAGTAPGDRVEIGITGTLVGATVAAEPLYDPAAERVRRLPG